MTPIAKNWKLIDAKRVHNSITERMIMDAMQRQRCTLDNPGICLTCGNEQDGCEPDARNYTCEACGDNEVYGAEELFTCGWYHAK